MDVGSGITPSDGAKLAFKIVGSDTDKDTYTTAAGASGPSHANPVIADSVGVFAQIFLIGDYDWILTNKNDVQISTGSVSEFVTTGSSEIPKSFLTHALAVSDPRLVVGDTVSWQEYSSGNGGSGKADIVLLSSLTPNIYDKVPWGNNTGNATDLALKLSVDGEINVLQIGADPSGTTDNKALLDFAALNYNAVYLPNAEGQVYGLDSPWEILIHQGFSIRTDNPKRSSGHLLKALSSMEAVIQVLDGDTSPGQNIITLLSLVNVSIDGDNKAVYGLACGKHGTTINQLVKFVATENLSVARCRIGYQIGVEAYTAGTDSANYTNSNTIIEECTDGGLLVFTQNGAAINFTGGTFTGNGFSPTADTYNSSGEGFNSKVVGGEINFFSMVSTGAGAKQPTTADLIARTADVRINGWWSDTHGIFLDESGGSDSSIYLEGIRHNEGSMTVGNTPISIKHTCKLTVIGSLLYGVFESNEGFSGSLTAMGVNFVSGGAALANKTAYTGTLKTNQKGVVSVNNFGNRAQIVIGGGNVDMEHKGVFTPQLLQIGAGSGATGPASARQVLGPESTDSGYTETLDTSTGTQRLFINCYEDDTSGMMAPILVDKDCHIIDLGGGTFEAFKIRRHKFVDTTPVTKGTFQTVFMLLQSADTAKLDEIALIPPKMATDPTFNTGDYWEGGIYYNTATNKLRLNIGLSNWVDLN